MLYSILPPALVLLSLAGIIVFLVKKAPAVAKITNESLAVPKMEEKKKFFQDLKFKRRGSESNREISRPEDKTIPERVADVPVVLEKKEKKGFWFSKKKRNDLPEGPGSPDAGAAKDPAGEDLRRNPDALAQDQPVFKRRRDESDKAPVKEALNFDLNIKSQLASEKVMPAKENIEKKDLFEKILIERIASNPKDIEAYERLGEYYMEIQNWNYAKECFKQVIKLNPGSIKARMKMRKLGRLLGSK